VADVVFVAGKGFLDEEAFDIFEAHLVVGHGTVGAVGFEGKVGGADERAGRHEDGAFNGMIELAHIAGPLMREQGLDGLRLEAADVFAVTGAMLREKVSGKGGDLVAAFTDGGDMNFDGVETKEKIFAEASGGGFGA